MSEKGRGEGSGERRAAAGDVLEVRVERIVPGGAGLAHAPGLTLFVPLAAAGDLLRVRVERVKGRVGFASLVEVVEPGAERVEPPCPYFGRCGGCDFQQLTYEAQLRAKSEIIRDCLRRIARLTPPDEIPVTPSPAVWRYRSRARWQFDARRRRLGYYELASHRVCDVAECPVVLPEVQTTLTRLRAALVVDQQPGDEARAADGHGDAARLSSESDAASRPFEGDDSHPSFEGDASHPSFEGGAASRGLGGGAASRAFEDESRGVVAIEFQAVAGDDGVSLLPSLEASDEFDRRRVIGGESYRFNAECFFQINHALLEPLVAEALRRAEGGETALDLYCGVGLFTLPLARKFARVTGVEANATACRFARANLSDAGLSNARIEAAPTGPWLSRRAAKLAPADFLLLDPPRAGADPETVAGILRLRPRRIAYVSCDPATLARDLRALADAGYTLDSLAAFDMFPQTHHVETVAHLSLKL